MRLPINLLRLEFQAAELLDLERVDEINNALREGIQMPPVVVYFDGSVYRLYDGFHRVEAYRLAGIPEVAVELRKGTLEDMERDWQREIGEWRTAWRKLIEEECK